VEDERAGRDGEPGPRMARMVMMSTDVAGDQAFTMYADSLRGRGESSRIFADECHTIIMDVGYRRDLEASKELHRYNCPVILLTATLQIQIGR
jgi:superfamily II DNA helicase RecQ